MSTSDDTVSRVSWSISIERWYAEVALLAVLGVLYVILHVPFALDPIPTTYHPAVQLATVETAISTAQNGLFHGWVINQSFAGANLHGILAAPIVMLGWPLEATRVVMLTAGLVTIALVIGIGRAVGQRYSATALGAMVLVLTPQFLLFTGLTFPQSVTTAFGVASIYGYLRFAKQRRHWLAWALFSAVAAGLATLNHFWGGVVTLTVVALDALVLAGARQTQDFSARSRRHVVFWIIHALALVPAGVLYAWYKIQGLGGHYSDYLITASWQRFADPSWWAVQLDTVWQLATTVLPAVIVLGVVSVVGVVTVHRRGWGALVTRRGRGVVPTPTTLWSVWFLVGLIPVVLMPGGAYYHSYYYWWALVPAAGLIAHVGVRGLIPRQSMIDSRAQLVRAFAAVLLVGALIHAAAFSGVAISKTDTFAPASSYTLKEGVSSEAVGKEVRPLLSDEDVLLVHRAHGGYAVPVHARQVTREQAAIVPDLSVEELADGDVLVTPTDSLPPAVDDEWQQVKTVSTVGGTSHIYRRTSQGKMNESASRTPG